VPLAAHACLVGAGLALEALVASLDGREVIRASGEGPDPEALGLEVAETLLARGAGPVLEAAITAAP
jgi:hydroxymethylbilane synthase